MTDINLTYTNLKAVILTKTLLWQYEEMPKLYTIFAIDGETTYSTIVYKQTAYSDIYGIDQTLNDIDLVDFETNYKSIANGSLVQRNSSGNVVMLVDRQTVETVLETTSSFSSAEERFYPSATTSYNVSRSNTKILYLVSSNAQSDIALQISLDGGTTFKEKSIVSSSANNIVSITTSDPFIYARIRIKNRAASAATISALFARGS